VNFHLNILKKTLKLFIFIILKVTNMEMTWSNLLCLESMF